MLKKKKIQDTNVLIVLIYFTAGIQHVDAPPEFTTV